jgi:carboxymethylenebutenolidase
MNRLSPHHSSGRRRVYSRQWTVLFAALMVILTVPALGQHAPASAKPVGSMLALGDYGVDEIAYLVIPATPPTVGIVLVPDSFGLDDFTKAEANRLASLGYIVLALDIYNGHLTTDPGDRANLTANLDTATVMKTLNAGFRFFHESQTCHVDHVVAMGWGAGAGFVFEAARDNKALDGAITFYGPVLTEPGDIKKFAVPLCAVYPDNDPATTRENVVAFQHRMKDAGNDFEAWFIAAGHGWSDPQSANYNPAEDREAWKVTLPFLVRIGAEPVKPKDASIIDKAASSLDKAKNSIESIFK